MTDNLSTVSKHTGPWVIDVATLITAVLVPILVAIFTVWLAVKWRDRLRVKQVAKLNERQFSELVALYLDRVPDYERVPPDHFKAFFKEAYAAKSPRDFRRRIKLNNIPVHLLLIARTSHGICGFLKAIYVPQIRCLFIAYVVSVKGNTYEERNVTGKILSVLFRICRNSSIRYLVYEICIPDKSNRHKAKARLFRHYFRAYGLQPFRIAAPYRQPEICAFDAGDCDVTEAELYIARLHDRAPITWHNISKTEYINIVSGIYKHIYLMSYAMAEPNLKNRYEHFLDRLSDSLFKTILSDVVPLK